MALDPAHTTLLVVLATPDPSREHQSWSNPPEYGIERDELTERWPAPDDLVDAALATLEREGLVAAEAEYGGGKVRWWRLRPYGRRFFGFRIAQRSAVHP